MKKYFIIITCALSSFCLAQVAIGKEEVSNSDVSLEFGDGDKGLILPWVSSVIDVAGAVDGTLVFDRSDKKVKYRKDGAWFDLSIDENGISDASLQIGKQEKVLAKAVIGRDGSLNSTPGVLVLSDMDKAMVLPKVQSPHLNIKNPESGMMVYDTTARQLAVFNGAYWSFWKP